jgi:hypothetical protein
LPERRAGRGAPSWATEHWALLLILFLGIAIRALAMVTYLPSLPLRSPDAYQYLARAVTLSVRSSYHPFLYSAILRLFTFAGSLAWLTLAQHLIGIGIGVLIYLALRRFGLHPALAALGAAPILLDGYQIVLEHQPLTESFFELFVVGGVLLAAWSAQPRPGTVAAAGILLGASVLIRFPGLAIVPVVLLYLFVRRVHWSRLAVLVATFMVPLLVYAAWFQTQTGSFALTNRNGFYLYGRVAEFADCKDVDVPVRERIFCPENLQHAPGRGLFNAGLPGSIRHDPRNNDLAESFSRRMILAKPGAFAAAVASDFGKYFDPRTTDERERWLAPHRLTPRDLRRVPPGIDAEFRVHSRLAELFRAWQKTVWLYGPLLAVLLLLGAAGAVLGWSRSSRPPLGPEAALFTLAAFGLLLFPTVFAVYHFRYYVPAIPLAGPAGVVGASIVYSRVRQMRSNRRGS